MNCDMTFTDINEMLVVNPGEHPDNVSLRYSFALECAKDIISEHMAPSIDTQFSYNESDFWPCSAEDVDYAPIVSNEITGLQALIVNMVNQEEVLHKLNDLVIEPSEIVISPTLVSVYWFFEKPLLVQSERKGDLVNDALISMMFDLGLNKLSGFGTLFLFGSNPDS